MSERNNERLRLLQKYEYEFLCSKFELSLDFTFLNNWEEPLWGLQYFFHYYDSLACDLLICGYTQTYCSSEANLTGYNGLHHRRTTLFRQQNHCAAAPSVPRDPRPLLHPSSSPPPLTHSPLCSDSPTTLLCRSLALSVHAQQSLFDFVSLSFDQNSLTPQP